MIVLDTSVALAFMNRRDADHTCVRKWIEGLDEELGTTPLIVAELDHLLTSYGGAAAARALRDDLDRGAYAVEWWPSAIHETIAAARRYESMELGLADASLMALAARHGTVDIATLDERHFRALRPLSGKAGAFTLLPADVPGRSGGSRAVVERAPARTDSSSAGRPTSPTSPTPRGIQAGPQTGT